MLLIRKLWDEVNLIVDFLIRIAPQILLILIVIFVFIIYQIFDFGINEIRRLEAQKAWNSYSKYLTPREREEHYVEWCKKYGMEKGYVYYHYPKQNAQPMYMLEASIDGNYYRGTMREISEKTGIPDSLCEIMFKTIFVYDYSFEDVKKLNKNV